MDFVVVGFGVGSLGVLLGVLLRGWLAARCERAAVRASDPAMTVYEAANAAECRGAGQAFLAAGGAVALATVGGLAGGLDDRSGALLVATTATVAVLGMFVWGFLYRSRNPMPPRPRRPAPAVAAAGIVSLGPHAAAGGLAAERPAHADEHEPFAPDGGDELAPAEAEQPVRSDEGPEPSQSPEADGVPAPADATRDGMFDQGSGATANGHPEGAMGAVADGKIVAFVGQRKRADDEGSVVTEDETGEER